MGCEDEWRKEGGGGGRDGGSDWRRFEKVRKKEVRGGGEGRGDEEE